MAPGTQNGHGWTGVCVVGVVGVVFGVECSVAFGRNPLGRHGMGIVVCGVGIVVEMGNGI